MDTNEMGDDDSYEQYSFNLRAFVGLLVSVFVGVAGLFALPAVQQVFGVGFGPAFAIVLGIEFLAAIGVIVSVLRLHRQRTFE
jgi:hypothetical protein